MVQVRGLKPTHQIQQRSVMHPRICSYCTHRIHPSHKLTEHAIRLSNMNKKTYVHVPALCNTDLSKDAGSLGGRWVSFRGYGSVDDGRVDAVIKTIFTYVRGCAYPVVVNVIGGIEDELGEQ
jgi:hypothetical protein